MPGIPPAGRRGGASGGCTGALGAEGGASRAVAPPRGGAIPGRPKGGAHGWGTSKTETRPRVPEARGVGVLGPGRVAQIAGPAAAAAILPACGLPGREGR